MKVMHKGFHINNSCYTSVPYGCIITEVMACGPILGTEMLGFQVWFFCHTKLHGK